MVDDGRHAEAMAPSNEVVAVGHGDDTQGQVVRRVETAVGRGSDERR